jgi:tRNA threonylcarbamoyladenosine biosynthesis protein TsaB
MRLLAIDTATDVCAVGVAAPGMPDVVRAEVVGRAHAERLMVMVAEAVAAAGIAAADLDRIAVVVGPGSFTGLRIGIAAARALALATGAEAVGIGALAVDAEAARAAAGPRPAVVARAAARGEVYAARYDADGRETAPPVLAALPAVARLVTDDCLLAGSAAEALAAVAGAAADRIVHASADADVTALLRLARRAAPPAAPPRPLYLRPPDARPQAAAQVARR